MNGDRFVTLGEKFSNETVEANNYISNLMNKLPAEATTEEYLTLKDILSLRLAVMRMSNTHLIMENMVLKMLVGEDEDESEN